MLRTENHSKTGKVPLFTMPKMLPTTIISYKSTENIFLFRKLYNINNIF